jgi:hypothetical protein
VRKPKGKRPLKDLGVDGWIISEWILGKYEREGVDWIHLVQDGVQWQALVNTVMNLQSPKAGNSLTS